MKKLNMDPMKNYSLIHVTNKDEELIDSLKDLKRLSEDTVLRFKATDNIIMEDPTKIKDQNKELGQRQLKFNFFKALNSKAIFES